MLRLTILILFLTMFLAGCPKAVEQFWTSAEDYEIACGMQLLNVAYPPSQSHNLWVLTQPMSRDYQPKIYQIQQVGKALGKRYIILHEVLCSRSYISTECSDGIDNDSDGYIDAKDSTCKTSSYEVIGD